MKKLSVFLALILFANMIVFGAETEKSEVFNDEAYNLVSYLCDVEEYIPYGKEGVPNRREFVSAVVSLFNCANTSSEKLNFTDVKSDDELYPILKRAVSGGLVLNGHSFNPEEKIEMFPAIKICVIAAGYKDKAEVMGGYPYGYVSVATSLGILDNISFDLSYSGVYKLFYNTLKAEQLIPTGVTSGGNVNYETKLNKTVLELLYDIKHTTGIMNANEFGMLGTEKYDYTEGKIKINDIWYKTDKDWNGYLGYKLSVYYTLNEESGERELKFLYPENTETLTVHDNEAVYSDGCIKYTSQGKEKEARLRRSFDYIYNGKPDYSGGGYIPQNGEMLFIDNNDDGVYDVLSVTDYQIIKANLIDTYEKIITDTELEKGSIYLKKKDRIVNLYDSEGNVINLFDIKEGSILSVKASKDEMLYDIKVIDDTVSGKLTRMNISGKKICIDDKEYDVSTNFATKYFSQIAFGTNYTFVLGVYGDVVAAFSETYTMEFGYLTNIKPAKGIAGKIQTKIFTEDGKFITPYLADKLLIDGKSGVASEKYSSIGKEQLIKYMLNDKGEIIKIDLPEDTDNIFASKSLDENNSLKRAVFSGTSNYRQGCFYPYFRKGSATVFVIPLDVEKEELFAIGHSFADKGYDNQTELFPYNVGADGVPEVIVYKSDSATNIPKNAETEVLLVDEAIQVLDKNSEITTKIYGWSKGNFVEYYLDYDLVITKGGKPATLTRGDLLRITRNKDVIYNAIVDFDATEMAKDSSSDASINQPSQIFQYQVGKVYSCENGFAYISNTKNADGTYNFDKANLKGVILPGKMAICDEKEGVRGASERRIKSALNHGEENASYIVVQQHYLSSMFAVIY